MSDRQHFIALSLPVGRMFHARVRISLHFLTVFVAVWTHHRSPGLAAMFTAALFLTALLHELAHLLLSRLSSGQPDELVIWPLGGGGNIVGGFGQDAAALTVLAGPMLNLGIFALMLPWCLNLAPIGTLLNPFQLPIALPTELSLTQQWQLMVLSANWIMFLANLIPIWPMDAARLVLMISGRYSGTEAAMTMLLRMGIPLSLGLATIGVLGQWIWLCYLGGLLLLLNVVLLVPPLPDESSDDAFMGYDFSQGYTSLERSVPAELRERNPGFLERWKRRRAAARAERDRERELAERRQLDELLSKVHEQGLAALSPAERKLLNRVSDQLRQRSRRVEADD